jgi:hypothetical protein
MHFDEFHTCAVALAALDMQEAVDAALIAPDDLSEWNAFRADPLRWFLQADEATAHRVWRAMQRHIQLAELVPSIDPPLARGRQMEPHR